MLGGIHSASAGIRPPSAGIRPPSAGIHFSSAGILYFPGIRSPPAGIHTAPLTYSKRKKSVFRLGNTLFYIIGCSCRHDTSQCR